ncbi:hypothetical protein J6590_101244 [Homalodisca vitripennis]|nr:hypothetical protein J6590_101244 [Homalodisca vitripennis]
MVPRFGYPRMRSAPGGVFPPTRFHNRRVGEEKESRRNRSLLYHLKMDKSKARQKVCKSMFLNTLSLGEWTVLNWVTSDSTIENNTDEENEIENGNEDNGSNREDRNNKKREK